MSAITAKDKAGADMTNLRPGEAPCVRRSKNRVACGDVAVVKIDGMALCAIHGKEAQIEQKKSKKVRT